MIPAGYPRDLPSALLRAARDFSGAGVVEIGADGRETKLDFPTLLELAARILAGLRANGVRAGDPAVVHCTEPVGFFAAFWACTLGGIRPLLVAPNPGGDRTEEGRERLRKITDLLGWTVLIGRPSDLPNDLGLPVLDPDAMAGHEPTSDFHRPAADDVAVLMLSSGSTGTPKIVQLTHRGLVEFAAGTPAMLPVRPGQTTLNWLPLDRSGAFLLYHLLPVFTGCTNIHVNTDWVLANPLRWLDLMDQHRVNHSWSPNFGYRLATAAVAGEPDRHWDLSALRSLVSGGEQITVPVMSEFLRVTNRFGVVPETFVAAWGMTETVTGITFARPGLTPNVHRVRIPPTGVVEWVDQRPSSGKVAVARPGKPRTDAPGVLSLVSVGAPAPGTTVRIVAPNGAVLPEGRIGQLQVASARVTPGYLGNLEADRTAFPVGNWPARKWLATGDQGFITGGQVVITGRDSERIIMSGKLHYAHDIESVATTVVGAEHGLVAACGVADEESGTDRLVVFYALTADSVPGMDQAIRSLIQTRLGLPAQVVGVPRRDFPTTPGGKILRPLLKQRWIDGTLLQPPAAPHVEPAGATPNSGPTGQGPSATPETTPYADEDPSERTTELPVVRLAWKRELQQSIPTPPQRPTLGTPTPPPPAPALSEPATSATPEDSAVPEAASTSASNLVSTEPVPSESAPSLASDAAASESTPTDPASAAEQTVSGPAASDSADASEPATSEPDVPLTSGFASDPAQEESAAAAPDASEVPAADSEPATEPAESAALADAADAAEVDPAHTEPATAEAPGDSAVPEAELTAESAAPGATDSGASAVPATGVELEPEQTEAATAEERESSATAVPAAELTEEAHESATPAPTASDALEVPAAELDPDAESGADAEAAATAEVTAEAAGSETPVVPTLEDEPAVEETSPDASTAAVEGTPGAVQDPEAPAAETHPIAVPVVADDAADEESTNTAQAAPAPIESQEQAEREDAAGEQAGAEVEADEAGSEYERSSDDESDVGDVESGTAAADVDAVDAEQAADEPADHQLDTDAELEPGAPTAVDGADGAEAEATESAGPGGLSPTSWTRWAPASPRKRTLTSPGTRTLTSLRKPARTSRRKLATLRVRKLTPTSPEKLARPSPGKRARASRRKPTTLRLRKLAPAQARSTSLRPRRLRLRRVQVTRRLRPGLTILSRAIRVRTLPKSTRTCLLTSPPTQQKPMQQKPIPSKLVQRKSMRMPMLRRPMPRMLAGRMSMVPTRMPMPQTLARLSLKRQSRRSLASVSRRSQDPLRLR